MIIMYGKKKEKKELLVGKICLFQKLILQKGCKMYYSKTSFFLILKKKKKKKKKNSGRGMIVKLKISKSFNYIYIYT